MVGGTRVITSGAVRHLGVASPALRIEEGERRDGARLRVLSLVAVDDSLATDADVARLPTILGG
jgi:hypothetical protein